MANIAYFQIPADDVGRAKKFYQSLLGWKIEPDTALSDKSLEWQNIITGEPQEGTMNSGGIYKRMMPGPIMNFVSVEDIDRVLSNVVKLGGRTGVIGRDGKFLIEPRFLDIGMPFGPRSVFPIVDFRKGPAACCVRIGSSDRGEQVFKWGFIDRSGRMLEIKP